MKANFLAFITVILLLMGCKTTASSTNPAWVDKLVKQIESAPVANPPLSIWRYDYDGQIVYFIPARCCDIYSMLYDANGALLCAPDGGFTGDGDGKCPDFFDQRSNEQLIWQDTRSP